MMPAPGLDPTLAARLRPIEMMIFDVDGVLTDGSLRYGPDGETVKVFNVLDGQGLGLLRKAGIATVIMSGRDSAAVTRRGADLGFDRVLQGISDKRAAFQALLDEFSKPPEAVGFMGDDWIDLPVMRRAGFAATVPQAASFVAEHAHWVSQRPGGHGAVREVCELILTAQGKLDGLLAVYLE